jgi:hypothetical protein
MWKPVQMRETVSWTLMVSPTIDAMVSGIVKGKSRGRGSRSQFVQKAVMAKLERDEQRLARGVIFNDWMGLSDRLSERRMVENRRERKSVRWCVVLDAACDARLRQFLMEYGARHGAFVRFVEDAVREAASAGLPVASAVSRARLEGVPPAFMIGGGPELRV